MKKSLWRISSLFVLAAAPLAAAGTTRVYVTPRIGSTIHVIDGDNNKILQNIEGIKKPYAMVVSSDGKLGYAVNDVSAPGDHFISVLDMSSGKVIKKILLSGSPNLPAMTNDGKRILVAVGFDRDKSKEERGKATAEAAAPMGGIDVIDTASLERVKTIPMKGAMHDVFMSVDGKYAAASSGDAKLVAVIDLKTEQLAWEVSFDREVLTLAIECKADGSPNRLFVELGGYSGFAVVDFATRKEVNRIALPEPKFNFRNSTHGSVVSPDRKFLWVSSRGNNAVFVFSLPDVKLVGKVELPEVKVPENSDLEGIWPGHGVRGSDPHWLTITPDGKTVYVSNAVANTVSTIDVKTLKIVGTVPIGGNARFITALQLP